MWFKLSERKMLELFANSEDHDQTPHSVASDLGLHCLPVTFSGVSRLQWVNLLLYFISKFIVEDEPGCFAILWFVVCVLSVMVCLLFLLESLVGYDVDCGCSWTCFTLLFLFLTFSRVFSFCLGWYLILKLPHHHSAVQMNEQRIPVK